MRSNRKISALLAMALFLSVALPVKAAEEPSTELTPPPELIILEGEEWLPNEPDPLIPTRGMDDDCRHNSGHPKNYRYIGAVKGSTQADTLAVDIVLNIITLGLPRILSDTITIISAGNKVTVGDKLEGEYIKYQYIYNVGPDPNMYWFHYWFSFATRNGEPVGNQCYATYSPKKDASDPYQD